MPAPGLNPARAFCIMGPVLRFSWVPAAILVLAARVACADVIDLYLFAGQSNMIGHNPVAALPEGWDAPDPRVRHTFWIDSTPDPDGWGDLAPQSYAGGDFGTWGPDLIFGRRMGDRAPGTTAIIKTAVNGASLEASWQPSRNRLYPRAIAFALDAIADLESQGHTVEVKAFFWVQGYTDSVSAAWSSNYAENMHELMGALRADLGTPDLPVLFTRQHAGTLRAGQAPAGLEILRAQQAAFAAADPRAFMIDIDDIGFADASVHYNADGLITIGERFFETYTTVVVPSPGGVGLLAIALGGAARRRPRVA